METMLKINCEQKKMCTCMKNSLMPYDTKMPCKPLPTEVASKILFTSVSGQVGNQTTTLLESVWTVWALKWPFTCVNSHVNFEIPLLAETLSTLSAGKRPLASVRSDVPLEVFGRIE
jgi:hypothetical protein